MSLLLKPKQLFKFMTVKQIELFWPICFFWVSTYSSKGRGDISFAFRRRSSLYT